MNYFSKKTYWLYSSAFSDTWWGYNTECSEKLEKIYADHMKRNNTPQNSQPPSVQIDDVKKDVKPIVNQSFETIDYDDESSDDLDIRELTDEIIDYTVTFDNRKFQIDMDNMQQINLSDPNKKRKITRVVLPLNADAKTYLADNYSFRGIAGVKA